ncbi:MAG: hypothetical protein RLZZ162_793, partial [Verrucomicrobiota bacterium]
LPGCVSVNVAIDDFTVPALFVAATV